MIRDSGSKGRGLKQSSSRKNMETIQALQELSTNLFGAGGGEGRGLSSPMNA
jgi:hypothetical protein